MPLAANSLSFISWSGYAESVDYQDRMKKCDGKFVKSVSRKLYNKYLV